MAQLRDLEKEAALGVDFVEVKQGMRIRTPTLSFE